MVSAIRMTSHWPRILQLFCTLIGTAACFLIQLPIESRSFGDPFAVFLACVFMIALLFGRVSGGAAVVLSSLLSALFFEPHNSFQLLHAFDLLQIQVYAGLATGAVVLGDQIRRTLIAQSDSNQELSAEDARKSLRLREVAHRVANNFSSLDALIRQRAKVSSDPKIKLAFEQASELVHVVARLTNRLSNTDASSTVNSRVFVRDVCEDLKACAPSTTVIEYDAESLELPLNLAVPLGLIINELVTNALKYAFSEGSTGRVAVAFSRRGAVLRLAVEDNGVGMNGEVRGTGVGLPLLNNLARSLEGKIEIKSGARGTLVCVTFPAGDLRNEMVAEALPPYLH